MFFLRLDNKIFQRNKMKQKLILIIFGIPTFSIFILGHLP